MFRACLVLERQLDRTLCEQTGTQTPCLLWIPSVYHIPALVDPVKVGWQAHAEDRKQHLARQSIGFHSVACLSVEILGLSNKRNVVSRPHLDLRWKKWRMSVLCRVCIMPSTHPPNRKSVSNRQRMKRKRGKRLKGDRDNTRNRERHSPVP